MHYLFVALQNRASSRGSTNWRVIGILTVIQYWTVFKGANKLHFKVKGQPIQVRMNWEGTKKELVNWEVTGKEP